MLTPHRLGILAGSVFIASCGGPAGPPPTAGSPPLAAVAARAKQMPNRFKVKGASLTSDLGDGNELRVESRHGLRKYMVSLKTSEAKNTVGAITRAAAPMPVSVSMSVPVPVSVSASERVPPAPGGAGPASFGRRLDHASRWTAARPGQVTPNLSLLRPYAT